MYINVMYNLKHLAYIFLYLEAAILITEGSNQTTFWGFFFFLFQQQL